MANVGGVYGANLRSITLYEHPEDLRPEPNPEDEWVPTNPSSDFLLLGVLVTFFGTVFWLSQATINDGTPISIVPIWIVAFGLIILLFSGISFVKNARKARLLAGINPRDGLGSVVPEQRDELLEPVPAIPELASREVGRERCESCGAVVIVTGRRFCPLCGAPIPLRPETSKFEESAYTPPVIPVVPEEMLRGPKCMVCQLALRRKESRLYCPFCGNAAHRVHLLEWVHVKKVCPMCGQHIQENELRKTIRVSRAKAPS